MTDKKNVELNEILQNWSKFAKVYDPIKCSSIDGTDTIPHDRAVERAIKSSYRPNRFVKGRPECTIFVNRLNHETTKDTIKDIFSKYGKLKRFRMVKDIVTGMPKGYAFVEYEEEEAAEDAYKHANKMVVDGNEIFVDFECERLLKGWKPRRLGGGFGGKKESGQLRFGGKDRCFKKPIALEIHEEEERKLREKERRKREEERYRQERQRERHEKSERKRRRSPPINSPGRRHRSSPPKKVIRRHSPVKENYRNSPKSGDYVRPKPRNKSPVREPPSVRFSPSKEKSNYNRNDDQLRKPDKYNALVKEAIEPSERNTFHLESSTSIAQVYTNGNDNNSYKDHYQAPVDSRQTYYSENYNHQSPITNNFNYTQSNYEHSQQINYSNGSYYSQYEQNNISGYSKESDYQQSYQDVNRHIESPKGSNGRYSPNSEGRKIPDRYHTRYSSPPPSKPIKYNSPPPARTTTRYISPRRETRPIYPVRRRSPYREPYRKYPNRDSRKY